MSIGEPNFEAGEDYGCGWEWDHTTTESEADGLITWVCTECGAEGWEETTHE